MFLLNVGHHSYQIAKQGVSGCIARAGGINAAQMIRREAPADVDLVLFDPQFYLQDFAVDPAAYSGLVARLCTYPWFGVNYPTFESGREQGILAWGRKLKACAVDLWKNREKGAAFWPTAVQNCVQFQVNLGCSRVILPAGLIATPSAVAPFLERLDQAIGVATAMTDRPLLASLPVEYGLAHHQSTNELLVEEIADSISARSELAGVYLLVAGSALPTERLVSGPAARLILELSHLLGKLAKLEVVVNFAESLGLAACALGASHYGTGPHLKDRRLSMDDYRDRDGGSAFPEFFSTSCILDLRTERHLQRLRDLGLLEYLEEDFNSTSMPLLTALQAGLPVSSIPTWQESRSITAACDAHYIESQKLASKEIVEAATTGRWLREAERNASFLVSELLKSDPKLAPPPAEHLRPWRRAFQEVVAGAK